MMNKIDGLNDEQRGAFDNLLKSLLDAQEEFERGIQAAQSEPDLNLDDLQRSRTYKFEQAIEEMEFLVPKEEVYLKLAQVMFDEDDETLPLGGLT